jgi:hypothetical protein
MAGAAEDLSLFAGLGGKHEVFTPVKTYKSMTMRDMSALDEISEAAA